MLEEFFADCTVLDKRSLSGFRPFGYKEKLVLGGQEIMGLDFDTFLSAPAIK